MLSLRKLDPVDTHCLDGVVSRDQPAQELAEHVISMHLPEPSFDGECEDFRLGAVGFADPRKHKGPRELVIAPSAFAALEVKRAASPKDHSDSPTGIRTTRAGPDAPALPPATYNPPSVTM